MKTIYKQFQGILIILYLMSIPVLIKAQPNNPCNSVTSINCGVPVTSVISPGSGLFDATNCYDYQYGQENIFEFTSGDAGTYTISTTGWGAIQFAIKAAVNGCDATGWNCIDPIYGEGTYLLGSLAANTTYYLLHDVSSTYGESTIFQVDCFAPNFPCQNITAIPGCGIPVNAFIPPGFGAYSSIQCQYYNNEGKERIYSFIPAASGIYTLTLNQNNYSYNTVGFSYKKASDGCNELSWNCITETSFDNTYLIGYLKQGITYYILQDAYSIAGSDFTMQVDCNTPSDPCATPIITSCGVINDIIIPSGVGSFNEGSCFNPNDPTAGKEVIFQFTPSATGNSVINITSMSYDYPVRYYFKEAAGGCNANNWTCLGESNTPVMVIPVTLVSGTTYLLMADGVNYNGGLQSFEITCPVAWDPCASVVPISCGSTINALIPPGIGSYNNDSVFNQSSCIINTVIGREIVYSFVPSTTGTHALNVLNTDYINGVSYLIKNASTGCNNLNWTCMGTTAYPTYYPLFTTFPLIAGQTYLIMLKAVNYEGAAHDFSITCPDLYDPCLSIPIVNCGITTTVNITSGLGDFTADAGGYIYSGKENIFEFTPTITGNHLLNVNGLTFNEVVQYFVKEAVDGCNNENWTPFANVYFGSQTFAFPFSLNAGTVYYIMADGSDHTQTAQQEFTIICPATTTDPCSAITTIPNCGFVMNSVRAQGLGNAGPANSCINYQEPGKENIYEFTASATGNYSLSVTAGGSGKELFFVKPAILGCTSDQWQCIQGTIAMQAGLSYYIMIDGRDTLGSSLSFKINCPLPDPCLIIQTIECGWQNTVNVTIPLGAGNYTFNNCNTYLLPHGQEKIFSYTPSQNGTYFLNANNISSQKVFFFIKNAATGCGPLGWDCIASSSSSNMYNEKLPYDLKAGNTYYIMVDKSNLFGTSLKFNLTCATGCAQYADIDGDGYGDPENANYSCFPVLGYVPDNSDCNDLSAAVNIDATEDCSNNIDDNCNGQINENCNQPPVAVCQNLVVSADINCEGIATAEDFNNGSSDPDSDPLTYSVLPVGPYPLGITNVVLTVTDPLGEFAQCNATINVIDDAPPVFNAAPTNTSYRCITEVPAPGSLGWTDNCDGAGNVTGVDISDGLACPETITRTWTFTDASGNSTSVSQIIVVNDDVAPVIAGVGANAIVECPATPVFSTPTVSDDCDINAALTFTDVTTQGNCASNYSITRTWTAFDVCGNSSTTSQTITVEDNTAPAIQCAADLSFCDGDPVVLILPVANDACGSVTITNDAPVLFSPGNHVVTWTATDACGNSSSCTQTVTVHYLNAIIDETDVLCYGDNSGSLLVNYFAIPPANPVSILYSVDGGLTTQSSNIFLGLPAGNYNVTIINTASNCTTTVSSTINQPAAPLSVVVSSTNSCPGSNTGTLSVTPAGGTIGYAIEWFDVTNTKINNENAVGPGTYTVIVTDANGCTVTATVNVGLHNAPSVSLGNDKVVFYGALGYNGCHNLNSVITSGTAPFTFSWTSTQPGFAGGNTSALNVCVTSDVMYTYTVIVTDANGCTAIASVNVIYTNIDCSNQQNAGKVTICRVPPGNPANCQTMCVAVSAAQALLNNGSYIGPCLPNCAIPQARTNNSAPIVNASELNVYPNPAHQSVHVAYVSKGENNYEINLIDVLGRTIQVIKGTSTVGENDIEINLQQLSKGIYQLVFIQNEIQEVKKLVVE